MDQVPDRSQNPKRRLWNVNLTVEHPEHGLQSHSVEAENISSGVSAILGVEGLDESHIKSVSGKSKGVK